MDFTKFIPDILGFLIFLCIIGYMITIVIEKKSLIEKKFNFKSGIVTQRYIDSLDMIVFKLGKIRMNIGDEIRVVVQGKETKGMLLGARSKEHSICILEKTDTIMELDLHKIESIKITRKYGRIF